MKKTILATLIVWSGVILAGCGTSTTNNSQLTIDDQTWLHNWQWGMWSWDRQWPWGRMWSWDRQWMPWSGDMQWWPMWSGLNLTDEEKTLMQEIMQAKKDGDTAKETEAKTQLKALKPELFSGDDLKFPWWRGRMWSWDRQWMPWSGDMQWWPMWSGDAQSTPPSQESGN